jgi:hypothetical protein
MIENLLYIKNKRGKIVPFKSNPAQKYYWKKKRKKNLVLKPRQKGITKIIEADMLIDCIRKPTNAIVISHEKDSTKRLFSAVRFYIDNLKVKPELSIDSRQEIKFEKRGSTFFIGTAGQKALGRGDTIDRAHLSEASFYEKLKQILAGISEATEYGQIDIESTPNGHDEFHDMWEKAKSGKSPYTPIFIPWFIDDEYSVDSLTKEEVNGLSDGVREMFNEPEDKMILTIEENRLIERVKGEWKINLTKGQIKWRRYKIWDKGDLFFQEYPEDDVSCFLQSGRAVFNQIIIEPSKKIPLDDIEKWGTKEERELLKKERLYAGLDGAEGTDKGDAHNFSVIRINKETGKAIAIYEYNSNEPIDVFCLKVSSICKTFNIKLGIEKQGVGVAHIQEMKKLGVKYKEWNTTATSRPVMITDLEQAYRKEELIETYPEAESEAKGMIYNTSNKAIHRNGKHDDRVFGRAIALQMSKLPVSRVSFI